MNSTFFNKTVSTRWKILLITHKKSCNRFLASLTKFYRLLSNIIDFIECLFRVRGFAIRMHQRIKMAAVQFMNHSFRKNTDKPLSLSTRITTTHSFLPTLISLLIERIRLLDNSLRRIIPSMLLYSNKFTYAPISAMLRTFTITTSSISGYLCL